MEKGQASSTASLIALLAVLIVLYVLLIPPDLRNELLDGDGTGTGPETDHPASFRYNQTVMEVTPGRIDYLKFQQYEHPLPSVNLFSTTSAREISVGDSVYVKNGIFDKLTGNISFRLDSPESLENAMLYFAVRPHRNNQGRLTVNLNGQNLLNREIGGSLGNPLSIPRLEEFNTLTFEVSGVGYRFWTTNEYELDDIKIFFDEVDTSTQESRNTFTVTETEKFNLEKATLRFYPDCSRSDAGTLSVTLNSYTVFSAVPDCGQPNLVELSPHMLEAGTNRVTFHSARGRYLIDQITVNTRLKSMTYPVYYFDLDRRFFSTVPSAEPLGECGEIDGVCPSGCDYNLDKDCCFQKTSNYWCDYQPSVLEYRCSPVRSVADCARCPSGYEDKSGRPPEACKGLCGDDTDNKCPEGCSKYYDKDCCFEDSPENFWCDDLPKFGLPKCKDSVTVDECRACSSGWTSKSSDFKCPQPDPDSESVLGSRYDVRLTLKFIDDNEKKAGRVYVNGYQFYFSTYGDRYTRNIDNYVETGTNAVKIEPDQTILDIRSLIIEILE